MSGRVKIYRPRDSIPVVICTPRRRVLALHRCEICEHHGGIHTSPGGDDYVLCGLKEEGD